MNRLFITFAVILVIGLCSACASGASATPASSLATDAPSSPHTPSPAAAPPSKEPARAPVPTASSSLSSSKYGLIVFCSERDGNAEIYTMNPDGSDQRRLTSNPFEDSSPAWSPDGSQIAFISDRDDPNPGVCFPRCFSQIHVINADGSNEHKLVETGFSTQHPDWHPDGTKLSFDTGSSLDRDIYVVNVDGSDLQLLIEDGFWADWSPDGTQIALASNRDGNLEIYLADADGSNQRRLTHNQRMDYFPAWSPDGERIAFMAGDDRGRQLFVMNADGSGEQQLTTQGSVNEDPAWSPDGSRIVFQSSRDGNFEIYTLRAGEALQGSDDLGLQRLTNTAAGDYWPSWGPSDASESAASPYEEVDNLIAFVSTRDGNGEIYVMNADGSEPRRLTSWPQWDGYPAWSPDGKRIAYYTYLGKQDWVIKVMDLDGSDVERLTNDPVEDFNAVWQPSPGAATTTLTTWACRSKAARVLATMIRQPVAELPQA